MTPNENEGIEFPESKTRRFWFFERKNVFFHQSDVYSKSIPDLSKMVLKITTQGILNFDI